ncbi:hypothetical protein R6Q59_031431 [Mikania micrantha]
MTMCYCGRLATVQTSWIDQNPGRRFYYCPNQLRSYTFVLLKHFFFNNIFHVQASRCQGFLGWLDPPMCPRAVVIIPGLMKSKNKLEDEIKQLKAIIGKKNTIIFVSIVVVVLMIMF